MRRPPRNRKPNDPILMGEPSPALTKIGRMNMEKLAEHIKTMRVEADRLEIKIGNLSRMTPPDEKRIAGLRAHQERLAALMQAAQERLAGKAERSRQRDAGPSRGYRR